MAADLLSRSPTPEDWTELEEGELDEFEDAKDFFEHNPMSTIKDSQINVFDQRENTPVRSQDISGELKEAQEYGRELQRQIDSIEQTPRPPFESIRHLEERLERENELYRRQFAWQMENLIRFTTNAQ